MERDILSIAGETNIGAGRSKNEDSYCIFNPPGFPSALAAVCDGIGGHRNGEVASMYCCRRLMAAFLRAGAALTDGASAEKFLVGTLNDVNAELCRRNEFDGTVIRPMGCTVIGAVFTADELAFAGVGDSRLYEYSPRTGSLQRLSVDDVGTGGALSSAVGVRRKLDFKPRIVPLRRDTVYLLCSDGLHHFVDDAGIADALREAATARVAVNLLMRRALLNGAGDNITVIVGRSRAS